VPGLARGRRARSSAEHCARISEAKKSKKLSAATCAKMTGKKRSAEHCANLSEAITGKKLSAATCARISQGKKGKKHSARALCQH
jgi:hypothetical protein